MEVFNEEVSDLIECSICTEVMTDPRMFPCQHTFCLRCLELNGSNQEVFRLPSCPICRRNFIVTYSALPKNIHIAKLIDARNKLRRHQSRQGNKIGEDQPEIIPHQRRGNIRRTPNANNMVTCGKRSHCSGKSWTAAACSILVIAIGICCYASTFQSGSSAISIESNPIQRRGTPTVSCKLGSHLLSCNNGFPVNTTSCQCRDDVSCQAICTSEVIDNFEFVVNVTHTSGEPIRSRCSPGNVVLGCHVWQERDRHTSTEVLHYFPDDDVTSCMCMGSFDSLCIVTCGGVNIQYHKIHQISESGNITVQCSDEYHVVGCGLQPHVHQSTPATSKRSRPLRANIARAVTAHEHSCQCVNAFGFMCYAICGRF